MSLNIPTRIGFTDKHFPKIKPKLQNNYPSSKMLNLQSSRTSSPSPVNNH